MCGLTRCGLLGVCLVPNSYLTAIRQARHVEAESDEQPSWRQWSAQAVWCTAHEAARCGRGSVHPGGPVRDGRSLTCMQDGLASHFGRQRDA